MKGYVKVQTSTNGLLPIVYRGKILKLKLAPSKKYPDRFHSHYAGSEKLVPILERTDTGSSSVSLDYFRSLLIEAFRSEEVDWNPYP